jgi:hypothetical protein
LEGGTVALTTYQEVLESAKRLRPDEQLRLLEDLAAFLQRRISMPPRRSILELQGLGKQLWQGLDAQAYVDQELNAWNG